MNNRQTLTSEHCYEYVKDNLFVFNLASTTIISKDWPGLIGIELEMLLINLKTIKQQPPSLIQILHSDHNDPVLAEILKDIINKYNWKINYYNKKFYKQNLIDKIITHNDDTISFEPGGQLEYSSIPKASLNTALDKLKQFQHIIKSELKKYQIIPIQIGMNPWHNLTQIGIQQPTLRYQAMNEYFCNRNSYGLRMMRQTCSIQVNLDFGKNENTLVKRLLATNLIAPFATAIFGYSSFVEGHPTKYDSFRAKSWQMLDPSRTGFYDLQNILKNPQKNQCIQSYLNFLMNANVIYIPSLNPKICKTPITFKQWLTHGIDGIFPTLDDFKIHCSLVFPEVRIKRFLELRSIDCQSPVWQSVPIIFYTSLIYNDTILEQVLNLLEPYSADINNLWIKSALGFEDNTIFEISKRLMDLACIGLNTLPQCYNSAINQKTITSFNEIFTQQKLNPSRYLKNYFIKKKKDYLTAQDIIDVEEIWQNHINKN